MHAFDVLILSLLALVVHAKSECQPVTWVNDDQPVSSKKARSMNAVHIPSVLTTDFVEVGDINCRDGKATGATVNYYTCTEIAHHYDVSLESFFLLNPTLKPDCSNILPYTEYCTAGFIEPLRSPDGFCGPLHNNATCTGTDFGHCCNAATWKCGDEREDCSPGTCYEGSCAGDRVYSTDGTCGPEHGNRLCAGVQGDCCNTDNRCGTGEAFCGTANCIMGNCKWPAAEPDETRRPSWLFGNSTDGTCGGTDHITCGAFQCCSKDGECGSQPTDCGEGCQPKFGHCRSDNSTLMAALAINNPANAATSTTTKKTMPNIGTLPSCGQTCFNHMLGQYASIGCTSADPYCLCRKADFAHGIRNCVSQICGTDVPTAIEAFGRSYCAAARALAEETDS